MEHPMTTPDREHRAASSADPADEAWKNAADWFAARVDELPVAGVIDVGPHHVTVADGYEVTCAQVQCLVGNRWLLRLSTMLMIIPLLDSYTPTSMSVDTWYHDDLFEDCTHGYLVSASPALIADLVMAWFRYRAQFDEPDRLGYCTTTPKALRGGPGMP